MKFILFSFFLILSTLSVLGQVSFDKGYFITNNNQRVECYIKNTDWGDTPKDFRYKLTETGETLKGEISDTREFGIPGIIKCIRADVKIDRSPRTFSNFSDTKEPKWSDEKLFLNVILTGKASLYYFAQADIRFYFYSVNDTAIKQLICKDYKIDNSNIYKTNNEFRLQLYNDVKCPGALISSVEKLNYKQDELVSYFNKYNSCMGSSMESFAFRKKRDLFNLRITPGINYSSFLVQNRSYGKDYAFKSKVSFRLGLDGELVFPFNKNKWALFFEPTYQSFNSEANPNSSPALSIAYSNIEFPIGLRYYMFLNHDIKLVIDALFIPADAIAFKEDFYVFKINPNSSFAFSGGFEFKRLSAQIRYYTPRNLIWNNDPWYSDYQRISFILGFKIL